MSKFIQVSAVKDKYNDLIIFALDDKGDVYKSLEWVNKVEWTKLPPHPKQQQNDTLKQQLDIAVEALSNADIQLEGHISEGELISARRSIKLALKQIKGE